MFQSIINAIKDKFKGGNFSNSGWRKDDESQSKIQDRLKLGKTITLSNPQSSRFQISKEDLMKRGLTKQGSYYTSDDIADMKVDTTKEVPVSSTAIRKLKYNPKTEKLSVQYTSGNKEYDFPKVPKEVIEEFLDSPSKGKYMAHIIRPNYSNRR